MSMETKLEKLFALGKECMGRKSKGRRESLGCQSDDIDIQAGYFQISDFFSNGMDSNHHFTRAQIDFNTESYRRMHDSFADENDLPKPFEYGNLTEEQQNDFAVYEHEWFEPALLQLDCVAKSGDYHLTLSLNYKDAPYFRSAYAETLWCGTCSIDGDDMPDLEKVFNGL